MTNKQTQANELNQKEILNALLDGKDEEQRKIIGDAIEKMENLGSKKQADEDLISRQAVLDIAKSSKSNWIDNSVLYKRVNELPSVNPQPKTGYWIRWYEVIEEERCTTHNPHCKCSECGTEFDPHISQFIKYCPNCGCHMVEPQESEE